MGIIFNIQKFSIHDGHGIRTTIFLKGCPLHCPWCSNVESQKKDIEFTWDCDKCIGCNKCIDLALEPSLKFIKSNIFSNIKGEKLVLCSTTEKIAKKYKSICPTNALSYEGYEMQINNIITEVLKDKDFYDESGGGVTISGGEIMFQCSFATSLLKKMKSYNLHTAIETTCMGDFESFKKLISYTDLLLCDIKHWDDKKHKDIIGVDLKNITKNIQYASSLKELEIIGRIPVIPNFNYSKKDAYHLCERLHFLGIKKINLLPYHNYGENKYKLLTIPYPMKNTSIIHKEDKDFIDYKKIFENAKIEVL